MFFEHCLRIFAALFGRKPRRVKRHMWLLMLMLSLAIPVLAADEKEAPIQDNSFLVEEAYNQEPGVVQHIFTFSRAHRGGDWVSTFTQEWPMGSLRHQFSFTPIAQSAGGHRSNDFAVNYRMQLLGDGNARVAVSPRVTLMRSRVQVMIPASVVVAPRVVTHWNLGATSNPRTINAAQSIVWLTTHRFNALVETVWTHSAHASDLVISPGIRWSYDLPRGLQIVPGLAVPFDRTTHQRSTFFYLSFEHPFRGEK